MEHYLQAILFIIFGLVFIVLNSILFFSLYKRHLKAGRHLKKVIPLIYGLSLAMAIAMIVGGVYWTFIVYGQLAIT